MSGWNSIRNIYLSNLRRNGTIFFRSMGVKMDLIRVRDLRVKAN